MTIKELEEHITKCGCYTIDLNLISVQLSVDDIGHGKMIYISSFFDDADILPLESRLKGFKNTNTATRYVLIEASRFCVDLLENINSYKEEQDGKI